MRIWHWKRGVRVAGATRFLADGFVQEAELGSWRWLVMSSAWCVLYHDRVILVALMRKALSFFLSFFPPSRGHFPQSVFFFFSPARAF
ncbi:hypothetical protein BCV70DRAFT_71491 [Testicularia cyperi]|uniref:Uncharacterized protein n=1 Tax=Testicularia cyperi TaxID=1882483 RepID=A0A317XT72_9BASI|nr:hypothetical protein BCV70DRAFT_71491 [Testicularia cyperi]